jgi:hypothetical protein
LWNNSGQKLATGTFTNETASGWQTVNFSSPVAVTANTGYVASYHTNGFYSADADYFATSGIDNSPLHAPSSQQSGGNGVYSYGTATSFPVNTYRSSNYWVDPVFNTQLAAA